MSIEPLRPEHADKVTAIRGVDPRLTIRRHLVGYAYAAHGNLGNPTPRYDWHLLVDGRLVDRASHRRTLVEAARANGTAYLAEFAVKAQS